MTSIADSVDFVEELRLRRWARENYCYAEARQASWHPIVHDEMRRRDVEAISDDEVSVLAEYDEEIEPTDSTILTDCPQPEDRIDVTPAAPALPPGRVVPLAPNLTGLHGPHEISPPHTSAGLLIEPEEMHYT